MFFGCSALIRYNLEAPFFTAITYATASFLHILVTILLSNMIRREFVASVMACVVRKSEKTLLWCSTFSSVPVIVSSAQFKMANQKIRTICKSGWAISERPPPLPPHQSPRKAFERFLFAGA
jgi:hypothetical protein